MRLPLNIHGAPPSTAAPAGPAKCSPGLLAALLLPLAAWAVLLLAACGTDRGATEDPPPPDPWAAAVTMATGDYEELRTRLDAILYDSTRLTVEETATIGAEEAPLKVPARIERKRAAAPPPEPLPPAAVFPAPDYVPGRRVLSLAEPPQAMAAADGPALFYAAQEGLMMWREGRPVERMFRHPLTSLQFSADGNTLLARSGDDVYLFGGPGWRREERLAVELPPGQVAWGPDPQTLMVFREYIQFSPAEERRIFLEVSRLDRETGRLSPAGWTASNRLAAAGTLPQAGLEWGHLWTPNRIDPLPAPLFRIDQGEVGPMLTGMDGMADIRPSADGEGNLFWIRTPKHESEVGRAWWRNIHWPAREEHQLTGRPASHVAVTPDGNSLFLVMEGTESPWELRHVRVAELRENRHRLDALRDEHARREQQLADLQADLERDLLRQQVGTTLRSTPHGPLLGAHPEPDEIRAMGEALRSRLREAFNIDLSNGETAASRLDRVLAETAGRLDEHPALILAVAAIFLESLPADAPWFLDAETTPTLSHDVTDTRHSDDLTFQGVLPFGVAREAISGRVKLAEAAREVIRTDDIPVYLLENLRMETLMALRLHHLKEDGFDAVNDTLGELMDLLDGEPTRALALLAVEQGQWHRREALALRGALRLAESAPTSADALGMLGDVLSTLYLLEEALPILEQAVLLDPQREDLHLALADCLLTLDRTDEARERYNIARVADRGDVIEEVIAGRMRLLEEIAAGEEEGP